MHPYEQIHRIATACMVVFGFVYGLPFVAMVVNYVRLEVLR